MQPIFCLESYDILKCAFGASMLLDWEHTYVLLFAGLVADCSGCLGNTVPLLVILSAILAVRLCNCILTLRNALTLAALR